MSVSSGDPEQASDGVWRPATHQAADAKRRSARSRRFSSIFRIIQMSPNSSRAEKAMDGDNQRYRDRTLVMSRVDPSGLVSSCQAQVVSPGVPRSWNEARQSSGRSCPVCRRGSSG
jgi:hypothetical protein